MTIQITTIEKANTFKSIFDRFSLSSLFQSPDYLTLSCSSKNLEFFTLSLDSNVLAGFSVKIKKIGPFNLFILSHGPVFKSNISYQKKLLCLKAIKKYFSFYKGRPLLLKTGGNCDFLYKALLQKAGFYNLKTTPESYTSILNLNKDIPQLRLQLKSKWRNQLNKSEKLNLTFLHEPEKFSELITIYKNFCIEKGFKGISESILNKLNSSDYLQNLYVFTVYCESNLAGFAIFIKHGLTATYYLGWSHPEYRKKYIGNYYLWNSIVYLKNNGIKYLDLGGINEKENPSIAKFKHGLNGKNAICLSLWI